MNTSLEKKPEIPPNNKIANPSCKNCYGLGTSGSIVDGPDKTLPDGTIKKALRISIVCTCVQRAKKEKVPWLQRHGKNRQPWLED